MAPYRRPPISEEAALAIEEVLSVHLEIERLDRERRLLSVKRATAVNKAMQLGASQNEIATSLAITGEAVRQWATNSPPNDPVEHDLKKTRLVELVDALAGLRMDIVSYLGEHGNRPPSKSKESLAFVKGCENVEAQLDALGSLADERLATVRRFAQSQGFTSNEVNQSIFEARQLLKELSK